MITILDFEGKSMPVSNFLVWFTVCISLGVTVAFYVLRSIGIYKLAKNNGEQKSYLAWIPCVWIYLAAKLVKEGRFFNTTISKMALVIVIVFTAIQVYNFIYNFLAYFPLIGYFLNGGEIFYSLADNPSIPYFESFWIEGVYVKNSLQSGGFVYPYSNPNAVFNFLRVSDYFLGLLELVNTVLTFVLYFNLFRNYWPEHYVMASIFSFFGIFAPFAFVIRNKKFIPYKDFLRSRYNSFYYGPQNPYYRNPNTPPPPQNPFEEFAGKGEKDPGDPFEEFSDKDKKD